MPHFRLADRGGCLPRGIRKRILLGVVRRDFPSESHLAQRLGDARRKRLFAFVRVPRRSSLDARPSGLRFEASPVSARVVLVVRRRHILEVGLGLGIGIVEAAAAGRERARRLGREDAIAGPETSRRAFPRELRGGRAARTRTSGRKLSRFFAGVVSVHRHVRHGPLLRQRGGRGEPRQQVPFWQSLVAIGGEERTHADIIILVRLRVFHGSRPGIRGHLEHPLGLFLLPRVRPHLRATPRPHRARA